MTTVVRRPVPERARATLAASLPPLLARIFAARGIEHPDELETGLDRLPAFGTMKGIDAAATRLAQAIGQREHIVIVADYDADGATACAVGVLGLRAMGASVEFTVPNRFEFGYGLTPEIVELAAAMRPQLIVTVDNGIASHEGIAAAAALGIDVLVTDHHLPGATLPSAACIVNPNQPGCGFPSRNLAGVGVMFYVLLALRALLRSRGAFAPGREPNLAGLLDLVALGTVADVVPLDRVNRILVAQGLARIRAARARPGVLALFRAAGRDPARATSFDLGFVAGPRLNAAGRLADMSLGIRCLLADSAGEAQALAHELDRLNRERREIEAGIDAEAMAIIDATDLAADAFSLCIYDAGWHQGVVGIVASRLKDRFHRPTVVFARSSPGQLRGSGRSIAGFHLRDALDLVAKRQPDLIERFGGHAFAAGLTLAEDSLQRFRAAFEAVAAERLDSSLLARTLDTDGELAPSELSLELAVELRDGVWGQGFAPPVFDGEFAVEEQRIVGGRHLRVTLSRHDMKGVLPAIVFNESGPLPERIRACYRPEANEWNGTVALQLVVVHWRDAAPGR